MNVVLKEPHPNEIKRTFFGLDGTSPARNTEGNAGWTAKYNKLGLQTKVSYTDLDGQRPARHKDGYTGWVAKYDKYRQRRKETHFGFDPAGGYTQITKQFDDRGRVTKQTYEDTNGKLVLNSDEVAGWRKDYGDRANKIRWTYIGVEGNPTHHKEGYSEKIEEYTEQGQLKKIEQFGYHPSLGFARSQVTVIEVNGPGAYIIEKSFLNAGGELVSNREGVARWRSSYDKRGKEIKREFFGVDGKPTRHKDGYAGWKSQYDEHGQETRRSYFGLGGDDRKLALDSKEGIAGWQSEYKDGKEHRRFFGVDGQSTRNKEGYAGWKAEYDERGLTTRITFLGLDGEPVLNSDKIAGWSSHYENGNETGRIYLGLDGKPTTHKDGYAEERAVYDHRGQLTEVRYFDVDGKPLRAKFVRIESVLPASQAEAVGLLPGDIVIKYNGMSGNVAQLLNERDTIKKFGIKKIEMQIRRRGRGELTFELVPGEIGVQWDDSFGDSPSLFDQASAESPGEKQR